MLTLVPIVGKYMNTPPDALYEDLTRAELIQQLNQVEREISDLHARRAELQRLEEEAQEHRLVINRALGCFVIKRSKYEDLGPRPAV